MIEVRDLTKRYPGRTAVNGISFTVGRGEIVGFLGPNGAGKSTTMRILTGYLPASSGEVEICGLSVHTQPEEVKRRVGYMPENNPLPEDMRVSEYLYFRGRLKEVPRKKLGPRLDEVLEQCDLKRVRHRIIGTLSKGYRQRVGIAEAILAEPPVTTVNPDEKSRTASSITPRPVIRTSSSIGGEIPFPVSSCAPVPRRLKPR